MTKFVLLSSMVSSYLRVEEGQRETEGNFMSTVAANITYDIHRAPLLGASDADLERIKTARQRSFNLAVQQHVMWWEHHATWRRFHLLSGLGSMGVQQVQGHGQFSFIPRIVMSLGCLDRVFVEYARIYEHTIIGHEQREKKCWKTRERSVSDSEDMPRWT